MVQKLIGKVAVITGGGSDNGIGKEVALAMAIQGMITDTKTTQQMIDDATSFSMKYSFERIAQAHLSVYSRMIDNATTSL